METTVKNVGKDDLLWSHDGCATSVGVSGEMLDATWRPGEPAGERDPNGLKRRAAEWWNGAGPGISLYFWPEAFVGEGEVACSDVGIVERIPPGGVLRGRAQWDGMAYHGLGPPPSGRALLTASFGGYDRPRLKGPSRRLDVTLEADIVDGRPDEMLHPMEIVDAALRDDAFRTRIEGVRVGHANTEFMRYDPRLDHWEVGVFFYGSTHFQVAHVDPRTGEVLGIVSRDWEEGSEPMP
jgi:hypothetical protein